MEEWLTVGKWISLSRGAGAGAGTDRNVSPGSLGEQNWHFCVEKKYNVHGYLLSFGGALDCSVYLLIYLLLSIPICHKHPISQFFRRIHDYFFKMKA